MKPFKLFIYLFPLMLVTAQASQRHFHFNRNNNEKYRYKHGDLKNLGQWLKNAKFQDLQQPLEELSYDSIAQPYTHIKKLYSDNPKVYHKVYSEYDKKKSRVIKKIEPKYYEHIKDTPKVYFVVGLKGSGKSTLIFALQGNQITKKEKEDLSSSDNDNNDDVREEDDNIGTGQLILNKTINLLTPEVATRMYGTTKNVKIYSTGKKITQPMAFCDTEGFLGIREQNISNAEKIVSAYAPCFTLKSNTIAAIVFVVSAEDLDSVGGGSFMASARFLKDYFDVGMIRENRETLKKSIMLVINKNEKNKEKSTVAKLAIYIRKSYEDYYNGLLRNSRNLSRREFRVGQLKHFFSLFLKKDVQEKEMRNANFFKLLDTKNMEFFYPYEPRNVNRMRRELAQLNPIDPKYLSLHNGPVPQQLIRTMVDKASEVNNIVTNIHKHLISAQKNQFQLHGIKKDLEELISQKTQLENQNHHILHDTNLELVYADRHVEDRYVSTPSFRQTNIVYRVSWLLCKDKEFIYQGDEPIYKIKIEDENLGSITWQSPSENFITNNFNKKKERLQYGAQMITFTLKNREGIKRDEWHIHHQTKAYEYANCKIKFYSRKCDLQATQWKVRRNKNKIKAVNEKINNLENHTSNRQENLERNYNQSMYTAKKYLKDLPRLKNELEVINCWKQHIFRKNSANHRLVAENIAIYNKVWQDILPEHKISINKTNQKHINHQWLDKDDTKEDHENNNNNQNNPSGSNVSASVSITTLLSILLNEIKKQSR